MPGDETQKAGELPSTLRSAGQACDRRTETGVTSRLTAQGRRRRKKSVRTAPGGSDRRIAAREGTSEQADWGERRRLF